MKYILINENSKVTIRRYHGIGFVPIPIVKTLGFVYHKFIRGRKVVILFKKKNDIILLTLLLSTADVTLQIILNSYKEFLKFTSNQKVSEIHSIVVNNRLHGNLLKRYGWEFQKDNWYIGKKYKLKLFEK